MIIDNVAISSPCDVRVYWNRGNPQECWCVDFGIGTVVLLGASVVLSGRLRAETHTAAEADPAGWLSIHDIHHICLCGSEIVLFAEEAANRPQEVVGMGAEVCR